MDATRSTVRRRKPALGQALQGAGFEVVAYDNGLSAYQRLREEPFELLLTDIVMPEMDGIELARRASELDPGIKIMFITGFAAVALNSDSAAPKEKHVVSMTDPMGALVSFQQALLDGEIRLRPAALDPELFVFADNPAPGVRRIRYVRLDGSTVTAFVNVANAGFRDGLPCLQLGVAVPVQYRNKGEAKSILASAIAELENGFRKVMPSFYVEGVVGIDNEPSKRASAATISPTPTPITDSVSGLPALHYVRKIG